MMPSLRAPLLVGLRVVSAASVSRQVQLGNDHFFVQPEKIASFGPWSADLLPGSDDFLPLTVVHLNDAPSAQAVKTALEGFDEIDDVWQPLFAEVLYIQQDAHGEDDDVESGWSEDLAPAFEITTVLGDVQLNAMLPSGPYFVHRYTGNVYEAYKLYADFNQAFIQSSYQDYHGRHHPLPAGIASDAGLTVAVPSRLYFTPTDEKPLAGVRLAVKDLFDLRGLKTGGGNRAFYSQAEVKNETATAVQILIDAGAIVIGKSKLAEFAFAPHTFTENIDYLLPFNPRGDGYNAPGASSGGSAAAIASYDWLDVSLGSDTGGSVRGPALFNGVHGNRPTQGAVGLEGALPLSYSMDTAGTLARDPQVWSRVNRVLYSNLTDDYISYPTVVLIDSQSTDLLEQLEEEYPEVHASAQGFIDAVAAHLSAEVNTISIDSIWNETGPSDLVEQGSLESIIQGVYLNLTFYEQWTELGKPFVEKYMAVNEGRYPYITPLIRRFWQYTEATMSAALHNLVLGIKGQLEDWAHSEVFPPDGETCSGSVLLYFLPPWATHTYKPDVGDDYENPFIADLIVQTLEPPPNNDTRGEWPPPWPIRPGTPGAASPVHPTRLASVVGLPDYYVTLGSFDLGERTFSNATMQTQSLPFGVNIVAAKGCDYMILDLVEDLYQQGIVKKARAGMLV